MSTLHDPLKRSQYSQDRDFQMSKDVFNLNETSHTIIEDNDPFNKKFKVTDFMKN